jgi:hypothetical protein
MRVLYVHQHFTTPRGASGTRSYEFARKLTERGHEVTLVCGSYQSGDTGLDGPFRWGMRSGLVDGFCVIEIGLQYSNSDRFLDRSLKFVAFSALTAWIARSLA